MNKVVKILLVTAPMKEEEAIRWAQHTTTFEAYLYRERPNTYTICRVLNGEDLVNPSHDRVLSGIQASQIVRVKAKS